MELTRILQIGAGRSTASMILALANISQLEKWQYTVIDANAQLLAEIKAQYPNVHVSTLKSQDASEWETHIASHDVVISMVPAFLHPTVAKFCLIYKKHLFTASYISPEMKSLEAQVLKQGLLFKNVGAFAVQIINDLLSAHVINTGVKSAFIHEKQTLFKDLSL